MKSILAVAAALAMLGAVPAMAQDGGRPDRIERDVRHTTTTRHHRRQSSYYGNRNYGHSHRRHHRNISRNSYGHSHSYHHRRYR